MDADPRKLSKIVSLVGGTLPGPKPKVFSNNNHPSCIYFGLISLGRTSGIENLSVVSEVQ